jgi:hypothetical protein
LFLCADGFVHTILPLTHFAGMVLVESTLEPHWPHVRVERLRRYHISDFALVESASRYDRLLKELE